MRLASWSGNRTEVGPLGRQLFFHWTTVGRSSNEPLLHLEMQADTKKTQLRVSACMPACPPALPTD